MHGILAFSLLAFATALTNPMTSTCRRQACRRGSHQSRRFSPGEGGRSSLQPLYSVKEPRNAGFVTDKDALKFGVLGSSANVVTLYSLFVLRTTGCGLPPGFLGLEGATEGVSYLIAVGIFGWSALTKVNTGEGLPSGPGGLLGLAEGLSFLTVFGGIGVALLNLVTYNYLPGFLPSPQCYGGV